MAKTKADATSGTRWSTRNSVGENAKNVSLTTLQALLVDSIDLYNATRMAHWNLKGSNFIGVHEMLEKFYDALNEQTDMLAERAVLLGGVPNGTSQNVAGSSRLAPYPADLLDSMEHLRELADRYAQVGKALRDGIDETDDAGDADTSDLLTELSRAIDKNLWMIEAHLHGHGSGGR
ncbi:DNA starvation/stationary phase protection protein Dps [Roseomonas sp. OT10]|uniref:DNA starvation/stationary phase protection protein Dps n=1 Tax=Roseomonas cutis TaxID=2897332 RepID=UPI001E4A08F4|nr:DNA starvation/stationary phase protection protein Dps [Roseomonas sp. OT10]UFN49751.1 DNA starvation/stationary phase protection protein Dps [Roseomonas sp. OT10]